MSRSILFEENDDINPITNPYYYAQDPLAGYSEAMQNLTSISTMQNVSSDSTTKRDQGSSKKVKAKKRQISPTSSLILPTGLRDNLNYVIRQEREKGRKLIKINVYDFEGDINDSDCPEISVQYVVYNNYDEIADATKSLITKILKKIDD